MSAAGPIRRKGRGGRDDWQTPPPLYRLINREVGFTLDAAASERNRLCERWLEGPCIGAGLHIDGGSCTCGLCADWLEHRVFCNPPYGKCGPGLWVHKFAQAAEAGATVVGYLSSAGMDTDWFAEAYDTCYRIRPLHGRVEHEVPDQDDQRKGGNTGGNMLIVWMPGLEKPKDRGGLPYFDLWDWEADLEAERLLTSALIERT